MTRLNMSGVLRHGIRGLAFALLLSLGTVSAKARRVNFDDLTIADLNVAFAAGTLTSERLVKLCLARIEAYDRAGPKLHAVIMLNPKALATARALDRERRRMGPRSPLHGIPVFLKDNYDTADLPTTGGSVLLEGSVPPDDAFLVKRLRDAGVIILGKVNLGEFAMGMQSSLGGQSLNPHDLTRTPGGSSGGPGVAVAAGFAPIALGTDTGGSIRIPATVNGVVGLKPTRGLLSRSGIIPLGLSLDTGGPMARDVYDIAVTLGVLTGVDPEDPVTQSSFGKYPSSYVELLKADALRGKRIGLARDFMGFDPDVDWVMESAVRAMVRAGATIVEVRFPSWFLKSDREALYTLYPMEFRVQIGDYLKKHTGPGYPKSLSDLIERAYDYRAVKPNGSGPNPLRWKSFLSEQKSSDLTSAGYEALHDYYLPMTAALVSGVLAENQLDAIVYPTLPRRPAQIVATANWFADSDAIPTSIANLSGFPDLVVPAGFTSDHLPVGISFLGPAFSEPSLLAIGYSFEQATHVLRRPVTTPALPGAMVEIP